MNRICRLTTLAAALATTMPALSMPLTISGSVVNPSVSVSDFFGTCCNPQMGLTFSASGPVTYNYSFTFDAGLTLAPKLLGYDLTPGTVLTLKPYLQLDSATLTATQQLSYGTSLTLSVDPPLIDRQTFSLAAPSGAFQVSYGYFNLADTTTASSSGSAFLGTGVDATSQTQAWTAGVDLITVAANYVPPPADVAPIALDAIGMDLVLGLSLDILREDFLFISPSSLPSFTAVVPDLPNGTPFSLSESTVLGYGLTGLSAFDYSGSLTLDFDLFDAFGLGTDPVNLVNIPVGSPWFVGSANASWDNLQASIDLSTQQYTMGQTIDGSLRQYCCVRPDVLPNLDLPLGRTLASNPLTLNEPTDVPEPATLELLGLGLVGVGLLRRRQAAGVKRSAG